MSTAPKRTMRHIPAQARIERNAPHAQQRCRDEVIVGLLSGSSPSISSSASRASDVSSRANPFFLRPTFFFICVWSSRADTLNGGCDDLRGSSSSSTSPDFAVGPEGLLGEPGGITASSAAEMFLQSFMARPASCRKATTACGPIFLAIFWSCSRVTGMSCGDTCGAEKESRSCNSMERCASWPTPVGCVARSACRRLHVRARRAAGLSRRESTAPFARYARV